MDCCAQNDDCEKAIENNHLDCLKIILSKLQWVDLEDSIHTGIIVASRCGNLDIVKYLVNRAYMENIGLSLSLKPALEHSHVEVVKYLMQESKLKINCNYNLRQAVLTNKVESVKSVVELTANSKHTVNIHHWGEWCFKTAVKNESLDIIKYILSLSNLVDVHFNDCRYKNASKEVLHYVLEYELYRLKFDDCIHYNKKYDADHHQINQITKQRANFQSAIKKITPDVKLLFE